MTQPLEWNNPDHAPDKSKKGKEHILSVPSGMSASNYSKLLADCAKDAGLPVLSTTDSTLDEARERMKRITKEVREWLREQTNPGGLPTILQEQEKQLLRASVFSMYFERVDAFSKDELHFLLTNYLSDVTINTAGL